MGEIIKRPYSFLCDFPKIYDFLIKNYTVNCSNGCMPPFFEYAQVMHWTEKTQNHRFAIWEEDGTIVAFCWYESEVGEAYFNVSEDYSYLIPDMIEHAEQRLTKSDGTLKLMLYGSQSSVIEKAKEAGYSIKGSWNEGILDFRKVKLNDELPKGYSFEEPGKYDMARMIEASWRGFDNSGEPDGGVERGYHLSASPHATPELDVVVKNEHGEYVSYAGMWLVPEIQLAYLEPLCTVPEYRGLGIASAVITEMYKRTSGFGAVCMTGGSNKFYFDLGYEPVIKRIVMEKNI